jgi:hydrogenase maturation protein HypF
MATHSEATVLRKQIRIRGIVQGVGFRPFIYQIARKLGLRGYVLNSSSGITIEVEGLHMSVEEFIRHIRSSPPPLAQIQELIATDLDPLSEEDFVIRESVAEPGKFVLVSPDMGTCDDCWNDFGDPNNRRFGYPFTNCTNCGPRYTIIQDIPYDRHSTTMACFTMCESCRSEYENPCDRRFHAQPNACPSCGPALALAQSGSFLPHNDWGFGVGESPLSLLRDVRDLLRAGKIIAIKGLGGFLLACDARRDDAVRTLRKRKKRSEKPFALMSRDLTSIESFSVLSEQDRAMLLSQRRPIVILRRRPDAQISAAVAPGNNTLGVMLPYTPLHYLLFSDSPNQPSEFSALVMTSGNISEEPIVVSNDDAWERLAPVADYFLVHNRDIYMRTDDSVVRGIAGKERVLRRSRGYVPYPIDLNIPMLELLACGGALKNTFCLTKEHYAILSQHIGDLENFETFSFFEETLANLKKLFRVQPQAVAFDLHPQYMSSRFAQALDLQRKIGVQHHHAHIASCMAENHLRDKVIGVAFDGTGYGTDGQIWGGEFLVADFAGFERRAHLRYVPLPGGDAAVRQPWRMAVSYLRDACGGRIPANALLLPSIPEKERSIVETMVARGINTIQTSSCGRLFDAVASLIGLRQEITFEGQAAIELETIAEAGVSDHYPFEINGEEIAEIDLRPMVSQIVQELASKSQGEIAAGFHNTLAQVIVDICQRIRKSDKLNRVCLSGGTFQNIYLLERSVHGLERQGFEVYLHSAVPANDGGISLGQAVIANEVLRKDLEYVPGDPR